MGFVEVDTPYSRVILEKRTIDKREALTMRTGFFGIQSAIFLEGEDDLVLESTKYYRLGQHFNPQVSRALMIGGGGFSFPKDFLKRHPEALLDVIEIDPGITELAGKYFKLEVNPRLNIRHLDGRVFLDTNREIYDIVYIDAFQSDYSIPYQLTTHEAVKELFSALNDDGVVIANIISAIEGPAGKFLRAELSTYKAVFPQVFLFPIGDANDGSRVQNIILVALKSPQKPSFESQDRELSLYLTHLWTKEIPDDMPFLTDDFAPVDQYVIEVIKKKVKSTSS